MIRAQGFFWLATRMPWAGSWQLAGAIGGHRAAGYWFSAVREERWPADPDWRAGVQKFMPGEYGDRRQEIVFSGVRMDEAALQRRLDACLLTDAEMKGGPHPWARPPPTAAEAIPRFVYPLPLLYPNSSLSRCWSRR